jgi:azurin
VVEDGFISTIKVQVCTQIKHKEKHLLLKMEFLSKHASKRKAKVVGHGVVIGKWYFMKNLAHVKNEILYASLAHDYVLTQLNNIETFVIYLYFVTSKQRTCYD